MRYLWLIALVLLACSKKAEERKVPATEASRSTAALPAPSPLADTAAALDSAWSHERAALNAAAGTMDTLPPAARFTPGYAARFDSLRRRAAHADSLRGRLRRYLVKLKLNS